MPFYFLLFLLLVHLSTVDGVRAVVLGRIKQLPPGRRKDVLVSLIPLSLDDLAWMTLVLLHSNVNGTNSNIIMNIKIE